MSRFYGTINIELWTYPHKIKILSGTGSSNAFWTLIEFLLIKFSEFDKFLFIKFSESDIVLAVFGLFYVRLEGPYTLKVNLRLAVWLK